MQTVDLATGGNPGIYSIRPMRESCWRLGMVCQCDVRKQLRHDFGPAPNWLWRDCAEISRPPRNELGRFRNDLKATCVAVRLSCCRVAFAARQISGYAASPTMMV